MDKSYQTQNMYITLQEWTTEHTDWLATNFNNKKIWDNLRDYIPHPYTLADAENFINKQIETTPTQNFAIFNEEELVGGIGITLQEDVYRMNVELGYWLAEPFWGAGIASVAVSLMCEYVWQTFAINRIVAEVFEYNKPSMRILEKNGFRLEAVRRKGVLKNDYLVDNYIWVSQKIL